GRLGRESGQHRAPGDGDLGADQGPRLVVGRILRKREQLAASAVADGEALPLAGRIRRLRRGLRRAGVGRRGARPSRFRPLLGQHPNPPRPDFRASPAARHKTRLIAVMHNTRGYHQEVRHVQRLSNFRNRVASLGGDMGPIGTSIENPDIEYHKLAESMGWWAKGPIKDPAQLGAVIKEAVAVVKSGQPALVNVWTQPR